MFKKIIILFALLILIACKDSDSQQANSLAEEGLINTTINDPSFTTNTGVGNFKILSNQGRKGIIVFNTGLSGVLQFRAFDLGCPYISPSSCAKRMNVNSNGVMSCKDCIDDDITFTSLQTKVTVNDETYSLIEYNATLERGTVRISNFRR